MEAKEDIPQTTADLALDFLMLSLFLHLQMKLQPHVLCKAGRKSSQEACKLQSKCSTAGVSILIQMAALWCEVLHSPAEIKAELPSYIEEHNEEAKKICFALLWSKDE